MIKYKKIIEQTETDVADEILCDKCNKNILSDCKNYVSGGSLRPLFGYGSKYDTAFDDDVFDICDDCYEEFLRFMGIIK